MHVGDRVQARIDVVGHLEDRPVVGLDLGLGVLRHLREEISSTQATLQRGAQLDVDRLFLIEDLYTVRLLQARYDYIQQLIGEINDGTLTQMGKEQRIWKITRPDLASLGSESENEG